MRRTAALIPIATALLFAGSPGIRPRAGVSDYPAHESVDPAAFGAAVIASDEAKKIFAADLEKAGYIVVEVGVFPAAGRDVDLSPLDFTLLTDPNSIAERTADASAIASAAFRRVPHSTPEAPSQEVSVAAGASVEHISYPDPVTGRKSGATIVGVGSGVGVGRPAGQQPFPPAGANGSDADQLEQRLWEKSLPDGTISIPVAGYLYFPKPAKKAKNATWVLQWDNAAGRVRISLR